MIQLGILFSLALVMMSQTRRTGHGSIGPLILLVVLWLLGGAFGGLVGTLMIRGAADPDALSPLLILAIFLPLVGSTFGALAAFLPLAGNGRSA